MIDVFKLVVSSNCKQLEPVVENIADSSPQALIDHCTLVSLVSSNAVFFYSSKKIMQCYIYVNKGNEFQNLDAWTNQESRSMDESRIQMHGRIKNIAFRIQMHGRIQNLASRIQMHGRIQNLASRIQMHGQIQNLASRIQMHRRIQNLASRIQMHGRIQNLASRIQMHGRIKNLDAWTNLESSV